MKVGPERARGLSTVWPALAGAAQAASIAMPGSGQAQGWLQVLSLAALAAGLVSLARHTPSVRAPYRQAAWSGGVFATTWLAGSFWWLYVSMHDVGGLPAPLAALAVCALAGALALYYAAASAAWLVLARGALVQKPGAVSVLFAALWTLAELMRGRWLTGFPWGAGGYAHVDGVLSVWAPWVGVYGMGALAAWLAMRLALSGWRLRALKPLLGLGLVSWGLQVWGPSFTTSAGVGQVALLQANISQSAKFDAASGIRDALQWYDAQLRANQQPLVVAPETAIPLLPRHLPEGYWSGLQAHFAQPGRPVALVGVPLGSLDEGYSNSVVALGPQGAAPYRYDKSHLVPFGEFIPPGFAWFIRMMNIPLGDFNRGPVVQNPWRVNGQQVAAHICFEDVFGEEMAQSVAHTDASVLVNLSNLAWFGGTIALEQHLNIARVRAMELGRPIVRATNTGATAHIDHLGRVVARMPTQVRGHLVVDVDGRSGQTPYVRWVSALGLWPLWIWSMAVVAWAVWRRRGWVKPGP